MTSGNPDLVPQWSSFTPPSAERPRGLLDELLEDGIVERDLIVSGHAYRVTTRMQADSKAWVFRCAVSCDGEEVDAAPWAPVFHDLSPEVTGRERDQEARAELARRALEEHLSLVSRLEQVLEREGSLRPSAKRPWRPLVLSALAALVLGALIVGLYLWHLSHEPTDPTSAGTAKQAALEVGGSGVDEGDPEVAPETLEGPEAEVAATSEAGRSKATKPVEELAPPTSAPAAAGLRAPTSQVARGRSTERIPTPTTAGSEAELEPRPEPAPPEEQRTVGLEARAPARWPVERISPAEHSVVRLEIGGQLYYRSEIRLVDVPPGLRGLRCITTRSSQGETDQGVMFTLQASSRVMVAYDLRVKKRPAWLSSFRQTGETLTVMDPDQAREPLTFLMFETTMPAGVVALGANTAATKTGKVFRRVSGRETLMYLVCVPEVGFTPAPPDAVEEGS